jgi:hypothetical protein
MREDGISDRRTCVRAPIVINSWRRTLMLFIVTWAGGAILSAVSVAVYMQTLLGPPTVLDWARVGLGGSVMACLLGYATYHIGYCQLAHAEIGDELLRARTLFSDRTTNWDDVGAVTVHRPADPKAQWRLDIVRVDGQRLSLVIPPANGQAVYELFQDVILNDEWTGTPHSPARIWGYILLGLAVAVFGIWWDVEIVREALAGKLWVVQANNDVKKIIVKLMLAVVAPMGGLVGFGTGLYHLVRRPIVITPGFHDQLITGNT